VQATAKIQQYQHHKAAGGQAGGLSDKESFFYGNTDDRYAAASHITFSHFSLSLFARPIHSNH